MGFVRLALRDSPKHYAIGGNGVYNPAMFVCEVAQADFSCGSPLCVRHERLQSVVFKQNEKTSFSDAVLDAI